MLVDADEWSATLAGLRDDGYRFLDYLTAIDRLDYLEVVAHLLDPDTRAHRLVATRVVSPPGRLDSVTPLFAAAGLASAGGGGDVRRGVHRPPRPAPAAPARADARPAPAQVLGAGGPCRGAAPRSRLMSEHAPARGVIALVPAACTSCMLCVRQCPTWCITISSHAEQVGEPGARRPKSVNVLDGFEIDYGLCMYCGICIDVCPFDALEWRPEFDYSAADRLGLVHDADRLAGWLPPDRPEARGTDEA